MATPTNHDVLPIQIADSAISMRVCGGFAYVAQRYLHAQLCVR